MTTANDLTDANEPVEEPVIRASGVVPHEREQEHLEDGLALCLSGGGYRAMIYHVGALWRLNELSLLSQLKRVSSVSGGSITAATLGKNWGTLQFENGTATKESFQKALVDPIRQLASITIDISAVGWGILTPHFSIGDEIAAYYDKYLFHGATLQDLPSDWNSVDTRAVKGPRFVINATNVMTGSLWRFSKPYMADYRVGMVKDPNVSLAKAVAASSAFPPFLSPTKLSLGEYRFEPDANLEQNPLFRPALREEAVLTDGGVYDNLGLEPIWKRYKTILVSDAGRRMNDDLSPATDWARHSRRLLDLLQFQTSNLRRRQIMSAFQDQGEPHNGAYWPIQADMAKYPAANKLAFPYDKSDALASIDTRLAALDDAVLEQLINWGYANCDASLRSFLQRKIIDGKDNWPTPPGFPY